jgi:formiminotetrahydrofolate cyclodeaminase
MGAMAEHSQKTYGHVPEISADLSYHSAPIANKLVDKGLTKIASDRDPSMGLSNVGFKEAKKAVKTIVNLTNKETEGVHELSREDEKRGHEVVRSMLRKKK